MTAHLTSAARAFEAVLRDLHPERRWMVTVNDELADRDSSSAAAVRLDDAGAVREHHDALLRGDLPPAASGTNDNGLEQAA